MLLFAVRFFPQLHDSKGDAVGVIHFYLRIARLPGNQSFKHEYSSTEFSTSNPGAVKARPQTTTAALPARERPLSKEAKPEGTLADLVLRRSRRLRRSPTRMRSRRRRHCRRSRNARLGVVSLDYSFRDVPARHRPQHAAVLLVGIQNHAESLLLRVGDHHRSHLVGNLPKGVLAGFLLVVLQVLALALHVLRLVVDVPQLRRGLD